MIPPAIKQKLGRLRRRERFLQFVWGGARWLALVLSVLLVACLIDYLSDRGGDTPMGLRRFLLFVGLLVAAVAGFFFILWPYRTRLPDEELALRVEDKHPPLEHRLISAVQLNKPGAHTEGMSPQLIAVLTQEAEKQAGEVDFSAVADSRRLKWSAAALLPVLGIAALALILFPTLAFTLFARYFLADIDLPRNVTIEATAPEVYPSGEKVTLTFKVKGRNLKDQAGEVVVSPEGQPTDRYALSVDSEDGAEETVCSVQVPASTVNFAYTARLGDGRLRKPGKVRFEPRPVIVEQVAFVRLPDSFGKVLDIRRFELLQRLGDIVGIPGSSARVKIKIQKPIKSALIELLGPEKSDPDKSAEDNGPEVPKGPPIVLALSPDRMDAEGIFELKDGVTGYRVVVVDDHDFDNVPRPRRGIRIVPEEPPQVALLKEQFPPQAGSLSSSFSDDFVVEGLPVPQGGAIPVAYTATAPYGIGEARLRYRVLKKVESGNDDPGDEKWQTLLLPEVQGTKESGRFDPRRGLFENSSPTDQVFFHAVPDEKPFPRTLGGGRFDFKTTGIQDGKGGLLNLKVGEQVEFYIEVVSLSKNTTARSESRVKNIVSVVELVRWIEDNREEARRLQELDKKQRGLFEVRN